MRTRMLAASAAVALGAIALAIAPVAAASAHDYLVSSDPAAGSTVTTAPQSVTLTFNDRVIDLSGDGSSTLVTVTGPDAATRHFETGCPTVADTVVSVPVALGGAGAYTVTYQIVSADGHTVSNTVPFTYRPAAGTPAAPGSDAAVCGAKGGASGTPSAAPSSTAAPGAQPTQSAGSAVPTQASSGGSGNLGLVIGIAIGIVVLAIAGVLIVVLTARRKPSPPPPGT